MILRANLLMKLYLGESSHCLWCHKHVSKTSHRPLSCQSEIKLLCQHMPSALRLAQERKILQEPNVTYSSKKAVI